MEAAVVVAPETLYAPESRAAVGDPVQSVSRKYEKSQTRT